MYAPHIWMRKVYLANLIFENAQKKNWNKDLTFCHTLVFFSTLIWTEGQRGKSMIYSYIHTSMYGFEKFILQI